MAIIQEKISSIGKAGVSGVGGAAAGVGTALAANSLLVPASLGQSIMGFFGMGSGIVVSTSTFAFGTTFAPVMLGCGVFAGAMTLFGTIEKKKLSQFLADVVIASSPMVLADGKYMEQEKDLLARLANIPEIQKKDKDRILDVLKEPLTVEDVCDKYLMYEKNSKKSEIKYRLFLTISWLLAKVDGDIHPDEIQMHNRMSKIFSIDESYAEEIRDILTPSPMPS